MWEASPTPNSLGITIRCGVDADIAVRDRSHRNLWQSRPRVQLRPASSKSIFLHKRAESAHLPSRPLLEHHHQRIIREKTHTLPRRNPTSTHRVTCRNRGPPRAFIDYSLRIAATQLVLPRPLVLPPQQPCPTHGPAAHRVSHGGGAAGTNNQTQVLHTPDWLLEEAKARGAFLYVPQTGSNWSGDSTIDSVMTMIDRAVSTLNANIDRLYATGYSNGGGGTWNLLSRYPGRFAAAMPLAGVRPATGFNPANLVGTPIITAHARDDATVTVNRTRKSSTGSLPPRASRSRLSARPEILRCSWSPTQTSSSTLSLQPPPHQEARSITLYLK